jgi:hypothetical protein
MSEIVPFSPSNFLLYTAPSGKIKVEVYIKEETVWLTQKAMAELFGVKTPAVSKHLANIFESGELEKDATISILETVVYRFQLLDKFGQLKDVIVPNVLSNPVCAKIAYIFKTIYMNNREFLGCSKNRL